MAASSTIWVSPDFLGWLGSLTSYAWNDKRVVREHHAIWQHANELFAHKKDPHFVTSCLIQLNRAVDFRDSALWMSFTIFEEYLGWNEWIAMRAWNYLELSNLS